MRIYIVTPDGPLQVSIFCYSSFLFYHSLFTSSGPGIYTKEAKKVTSYVVYMNIDGV